MRGEIVGFSAMDHYDSLISRTDAELLKRAWRNEKAAPEILQFKAALVQRSREQIQLRELWKNPGGPGLLREIVRSNFAYSHHRRHYPIISYGTITLKIEKYMVRIGKTAALWNRLSKQEQKFAKRCVENLEAHFEKLVLSKLPDRYESSLKQSVISEEDDMVPEP